MRFPIIGCGFIGRRHLLNLRTLGYNNGLVYTRDYKYEKPLERELEVRTYWNLDEARVTLI